MKYQNLDLNSKIKFKLIERPIQQLTSHGKIILMSLIILIYFSLLFITKQILFAQKLIAPTKSPQCEPCQQQKWQCLVNFSSGFSN